MQMRFKLPLVALAASAILMGCTNTQTQTNTQSNANTPEVKAYARFVPERRDDFAWENDRVAFRVYGPAAPLKGHSSGVDAWFKKVDYSIIDKWYKNYVNGISYHEDRGEGYDPYHTGISRGVGGTAIWLDGQAYTAHSFKRYNIIESGNDKAAFELEYEWFTPLGIVKEIKTISLPMGTQLFQVDSVFTLDGKPQALPIAIGVATHDEKAKVAYNKDTGRISAWEVIDNLGVGTGALLNPSQVEGIKHIPSDIKDESHIWMFTTTDKQGKLSYKSGFAWEGAGKITSNQAWQNYLDNVKN
ncbi:DUF4861 family protein [Aliiglaciecola sp. 3_MG-2023]|uniref:DUF4861 family protein n=1 Tax=Aliiglaciecola sp. 3_MG-2023 TaxID=3062644 RepID=UPI0026E2A724|nr:DUF4861 family protein [Aliiglaciecola sp. 3_MG-2023]MDO6693312.1 DUF4861 family protein [Aliiglaciecola sp. 3_MG-2023]